MGLRPKENDKEKRVNFINGIMAPEAKGESIGKERKKGGEGEREGGSLLENRGRDRERENEKRIDR